MEYHIGMKKYNFVTWWLDLPIKPLAYRVWKMVATPVMFILWVVFVAVYTDYYWQFSLYVVLPVAAVDFIWDGLQYYLFKKGKLSPRVIASRYDREKPVAENVAESADAVDNNAQ